MSLPLRGDVWLADMDPVIGHEQGRIRPVLIMSNDIINQGPTRMVTVVPITSKERKLVSYIRIAPPEGGLKVVSFIIGDQVRTISKERLQRVFGKVNAATLELVEKRLVFLLDLG